MRFLHTADWQIGMKAAHVGPVGQRVRDERLAAAERVAAIAEAAQVELLILAGDTFEDNGVGPVLVQKVSDILAACRRPVFLLPGNHDPLVPGSVWEHPAWSPERQLFVLRTNEPTPIPGGVIFPAPCRQKHSQGDPTAAIDARAARGIKLGIAHGTVAGVPQDEPDYPIAREAAQRAGLDYLALGHWHSTAYYPDATGAVRMAYSGTHEATKFGERASGQALVVEIDEPGGAPRVTAHASGGLNWKIYEEQLREAGQLAELAGWLEQLPDPRRTLLEVRLAGVLPAEECSRLRRLEELAQARLLYARFDTGAVRPAPTDEVWLARLPAGPVRQTAHRLREWADPAFAGPRPEGATVEAASRALLELYLLAEESRA